MKTCRKIFYIVIDSGLLNKLDRVSVPALFEECTFHSTNNGNYCVIHVVQSAGGEVLCCFTGANVGAGE